MQLLLVFLSIVVIAFGCYNDGSLKNVGEQCKSSSDCYSGGSTDAVSCKSGICTCNDGYMPQMQWFTTNLRHLVCQPAPYQAQACTTICQKPFTCANSSTNGLKTCQCLPPAKIRNGICYRECESDNVFDNGECRQRCSKDEIVDRSRCKRLSKVGEKCESRNQCLAPYSQCVNGMCSCIDGFRPNAKRDVCESSMRACPVGNPVLRGGKIIECKVTRREGISGLSRVMMPYPRSELLQDNCEPGQFCAITSGESYYAEGASGHCCLHPNPTCPYGKPHPNATCGAPIPDKSGKVRPNQYCPYETHSCIRFGAAVGFELMLCCPIACGRNHVRVNGVCYPKRDWGDRCEVNEQCKDHVGLCENGRCTCDKDYVNDAGPTYNYCRRVCKDNEVLVDTNRCVPKLKLGDKCDQQIYAQCPLNSYCSPDRGICDCFCGFMQLEDGTCGPQPMCPDSRPPNNLLFPDSTVNRTSVTLCRIPGRPNSSSLSTVESCPNGQYCASYVANLGLCCPKPEKPFCPNGGVPGEKCDPKNPNPCGFLGYCNRYLIPAADDGSSEGYVCCPLMLPVDNLNATDVSRIE